MFKKLFIIIPFAVYSGAVQVNAYTGVLPSSTHKEVVIEKTFLAEQTMDLSIRYPEPYINGVFKDNILLNLAYLSGKVQNAAQVNWDEIRKSSSYEFTLQPGEVFAYHDGVLPQFEGRVTKIGGSHFGGEDGYRSSGYLYGDGVCHFATLINWTAQSAGLQVTAPTNHNFAPVPGVDPIYGTSIYYAYGQPEVSGMQNLYVENTYEYPVTIHFTAEGNSLKVSIYR